MKIIFAMITIALMPVLILAQGTPLSALYDEFLSTPGFTTTEIRPGETSYDWEKEIDANQIKEVMSSIDAIRILEYDGEGDYNSDKLRKKMIKASGNDIYTQVIEVNADKGEAVVYMTKNPSGTMREMTLIAFEDKKTIMVSVSGDMDFKNMLNPETMKNLRELGHYYMKGKDGCGVK